MKIVLVGTTHPGNIGAAARAMKTMGLEQLVLVAPQKYPHEQATAMASGADDVLQRAKVVDTLDQALDGCSVVFGMTARKRRLSSEALTPSAAVKQALIQSEQVVETSEKPASENVAFVFGREHSGLTNEELDRCNYLVHIDANPSYSSLNLGAAVQVISYEIRKQKVEDVSKDQTADKIESEDFEPATADEMALFYQHLEKVLIKTEFYNPDNPRKLMRRLRRLYNRTHMDKNEMNIMRGILASVERASTNKTND